MGESRSGRVYGRVSQLFTVRPRADCDTESLTAALSYVARAKLETTLTDTAAAAKAESEKHGSKVWPLEYLPSKAVPPADPVVESEPLVLRASALLAPAEPELAPFLASIFGSTVVVQTKEDAHAFRRSGRGSGTRIVALDGELLDSDGAFGGPRRVFTRLQGPRAQFGVWGASPPHTEAALAPAATAAGDALDKEEREERELAARAAIFAAGAAVEDEERETLRRHCSPLLHARASLLPIADPSPRSLNFSLSLSLSTSLSQPLSLHLSPPLSLSLSL